MKPAASIYLVLIVCFMFESLKAFTVEQIIIIFSTPLYTVLILGEIILSNIQDRRFYTVKDTLTNIYLMLLNGGIDLLSRGITWLILAWAFQYRFFEIQNPVLYWGLLFVAEDFLVRCFYFRFLRSVNQLGR